MKTRAGFVSNSSSTSFVILLPKKFNKKDFNWNIMERLYIPSGISTEDTRKSIEEDLDILLKNKTLYGEESRNVYAVAEGLREYQVASIETGCDGQSAVTLLSVDKVKRILKTK